MSRSIRPTSPRSRRRSWIARLSVTAVAAGVLSTIGPGNVIAAPASVADPAGCEDLASTTFANTTPAPVPADPATGLTTSTLTVRDAGPVLRDIDLFTDLRHSFNADVEMTLESPAGTVATMTTHNGGDNDDVFAGTTWDDDADRDNPVPYSAAPVAVVTDHVFTNGVTASRLVPEEALSAFANEDPNGPWTLTILDADHAGDTGTLDSWSLNLATRRSAENHVAVSRSSQNPVRPVKDGAGVYSVLEVAGIGSRISDTTVRLQLPHAHSQDLEISLTSPDRTTATLTTGNGEGADNFADIVFDDHADPGSQVPYAAPARIVTDHPFTDTPDRLVPEEAMGAFRGEDPNGDWILRVVDTDANGLHGSLDAWSLNITPSVCDDEVLGLKAKTNARLQKRWFVQAKVRVDEPAWIQVTGKAKAKGKGKGMRFFHVRKQVRRATPGYEQVLRMRLHPRVYRQIQRTHNGYAKLFIRVTDSAGNVEVVKRGFRIERKW